PMDAAPASAHSAFPQRPVQAPRYANPYGAGGMSPGQESPEERKLLIGRGITMSGEIDSCDTLVVEGTVEASLRGARFLDVASTGVFYGAVEIDEANISGRFEGDITVNGRLTITSTGSITGTISYKEMAMEAGAIIDGKISPLGATAGAREEKAGASRKVVKSVGARDGERDANQLPLSSAAA
ncbi:MAG: polymer-forming cytoskeletal protein, partial [Alphaproteobacteria bacterium]|nr:polymer-forming cytoskeletal protein [Alphaproteobacteria bacterium]